MRSVEERTETLQSLLRGELSAVETYRQALEKVGDEPGAVDVRRIERDHQEAADTLRMHIVQRGGQPADSSGAWGSWAQLVTGMAKLFGDTATLKALKEGEEHGLKEYEEALEDENLDPECKVLIRNTLIPRQREHIRVLDRLLGARS
jgi:uncharacterized protein (TIGR02284 family)